MPVNLLNPLDPLGLLDVVDPGGIRKSGRKICLKPCAPVPVPQLRIPMMGSSIQAQGDLTVRMDCSGCDIVGNFLLQLNPFMSALGLPLCLLGCVGALVSFATVVPDTLGPPPDPTVLLETVANVIKKCKCVVGMVLPPPVGVICDFLQMVSDIVNILDAVLACIISLITTIASFQIRASLLLLSPVPELVAAGQCLQDQGAAILNAMLSKMGSLATLLQLIQPIFQILESVVPDPFSAQIQALNDGFSIFFGNTPVGAPLQGVVDALSAIKDVVHPINQVLAILANDICP